MARQVAELEREAAGPLPADDVVDTASLGGDVAERWAAATAPRCARPASATGRASPAGPRCRPRGPMLPAVRASAAATSARSSGNASCVGRTASISSPAAVPARTRRSPDSSSVRATSNPLVQAGPVPIEAQKHVGPARAQSTPIRKAASRRARYRRSGRPPRNTASWVRIACRSQDRRPTMATGRTSIGASSTESLCWSRRTLARVSRGGNRNRLADSGPQVTSKRRVPPLSRRRYSPGPWSSTTPRARSATEEIRSRTTTPSRTVGPTSSYPRPASSTSSTSKPSTVILRTSFIRPQCTSTSGQRAWWRT